MKSQAKSSPSHYWSGSHSGAGSLATWEMKRCSHGTREISYSNHSSWSHYVTGIRWPPWPTFVPQNDERSHKSRSQWQVLLGTWCSLLLSARSCSSPGPCPTLSRKCNSSALAHLSVTRLSALSSSNYLSDAPFHLGWVRNHVLICWFAVSSLLMVE